jgi:pimeloyl-ACP methyl ester carboxylesterase
MKKIHCISGLGADERIFQNLSIPGAELVYVHWAPFSGKDDVYTYAKKMSRLITEEKPIILGLSFGGMLAVEIAKQCDTKKVFIVSSAKTKDELTRGVGGLFAFLVKNNLIPAKLYTIPNYFFLRRFGAVTKEEKKLVSYILRGTDPHFVKWAMKALVQWENKSYPENITHIHGTSDGIIMPGNIKADYWIEGGTHMMIYNRAEEISKIIANNL